MAFYIRICASVSGLLGFVLFFGRFHISRTWHSVTSGHSIHSLSKYMDSFLSAALDCLCGGIISACRVDTQCGACFCYHHYCSHGIVSHSHCHGLLFTAPCYDLNAPRLTQRWSQRRLRLSVSASDFRLAAVTGGVAQLLSGHCARHETYHVILVLGPRAVGRLCISHCHLGFFTSHRVVDSRDGGQSSHCYR